MEKMEVEVVGVITGNKDIIKETTATNYEINGGHAANICYTQKDYNQILEEDLKKTIDRAENNKSQLHHSVFGHDAVKMYLKGIPKILAMIINNENEYNTSEKSGRYTIMFGDEKENEYYNKWVDIYEKEIKSYYPDEKYLTDKMINKKAKENARYLLSVFTRTKMLYTTSFRQLNYLYQFADRMLNEETNNPLKNEIKLYLEEFKEVLKSTGFITENLEPLKHRRFSMIEDNVDYEEYFGNCYSVNYSATFPAYGELARQRSLDYSFALKEKKEFYIPPIIRTKKDLVDEWLDDISSLSEFPQGMLLDVNENGNYKNFISKLYTRLCTGAQLEVTEITKDTLTRYINALENSESVTNQKIYEELLKRNNGAACTFSDFDCPTPCHFKEGVLLKRKI